MMRASRAAQCRTRGKSLNETELTTGRENANRTRPAAAAAERKAPTADRGRAGGAGWNTRRPGRARVAAAAGAADAGRSLSIGGGQAAVDRVSTTAAAAALGLNGRAPDAGRAGLTTSTRTHIELPHVARCPSLSLSRHALRDPSAADRPTDRRPVPFCKPPMSRPPPPRCRLL